MMWKRFDGKKAKQAKEWADAFASWAKADRELRDTLFKPRRVKPEEPSKESYKAGEWSEAWAELIVAQEKLFNTLAHEATTSEVKVTWTPVGSVTFTPSEHNDMQSTPCPGEDLLIKIADIDQRYCLHELNYEFKQAMDDVRKLLGIT